MIRGAFLAVLAGLPLAACGREPPLVSVTVVEPIAPPTRTLTLSALPTPSAQPRPTATATTTAPAEPTPTPKTVRVGSTRDQPIYLYNSPTVGDRIQSYPESTQLVIIGNDVEGDGLTWHIVRAPDGTEGYIPVGETISEP